MLEHEPTWKIDARRLSITETARAAEAACAPKSASWRLKTVEKLAITVVYMERAIQDVQMT